MHHLESETLVDFREKNFTSNRLSLIGVGIKHDDLVRIADQYRLPTGNSNREKSKYIGGEVRQENALGLVHVALASEGVSLASKDLLASGIASHAFGAGPRIKYSAGSNKLARAIAPLASSPALVSSFNANYSDSGLFGFTIVGQKNDIGKIVQGVFKEVAKTSKNGLTNDEIANAK